MVVFPPPTMCLVTCLPAIKDVCCELSREAAVKKVVREVHLSAKTVSSAVLRTSRLCC